VIRVAIPAVVAAALALAACGGGGGGGAREITVDLVEQNASGQSGTVTLSRQGDKTQVVIESFSPFGRVPQPAHIHKGTCANLDPAPAYPLPSLVDGIAGDTVNVSLDELLDGEYAVNVHRSAAEADLYTACADITE
jgi:hypothetical protein